MADNCGGGRDDEATWERDQRLAKTFRDPDPFTPERLGAALARSVLAGLPTPRREAILAAGVRSEIPKGRFLDGPPFPWSSPA